MAGSRRSFLQHQKDVKRKQKREEKLQRKIDKRDQGSSGTLGIMMANVDEFRNILDEPPKEKETKTSNK